MRRECTDLPFIMLPDKALLIQKVFTGQGTLQQLAPLPCPVTVEEIAPRLWPGPDCLAGRDMQVQDMVLICLEAQELAPAADGTIVAGLSKL